MKTREYGKWLTVYNDSQVLHLYPFESNLKAIHMLIAQKIKNEILAGIDYYYYITYHNKITNHGKLKDLLV